MRQASVYRSGSLRTLAVLSLLSAGCADGSDTDSAPQPHEHASDAATAAQDDVEAFNGCKLADYVDMSGAEATRTITIAATGLTFTPKCMIIAKGQSVRWEGNLTAHPLAPGSPDDALAGSADNPIEETNSGRSATFAFPDTGTFPYYCVLHAFGAGQGMAGTILVR